MIQPTIQVSYQLEQWKNKTKQENPTAEPLWTALRGPCAGNEAVKCPGPPEHCMHLLWVIEEVGKYIWPPCASSKCARKPLKGRIANTRTLIGVENAQQRQSGMPRPRSRDRVHLCLSHCRAPASPGLHSKIHFPFWASCSVSFREPAGGSHSSLQH